MFGRSTFTMEFNPAEDKTSFFQDMEGDEECVPIADAKQSYLDLVELGQHGVIPVGAMVKIFQAFADTQVNLEKIPHSRMHIYIYIYTY